MVSDYEKDKNSIIKLLKSINRPLSIADIKRQTEISINQIRVTLARMEGEATIKSYKIGRATVHELI